MSCKHERATGFYTHIVKEDIDKYKRTVIYRCDDCGEVFELDDYITFDGVFGDYELEDYIDDDDYDEDDYVEVLEENKKLKDRLEVLEKENRLIINSILGTTQYEWLNENNKLQQQNEKLKKAIEILKGKVRITVKIPYVWVETKDNCVYFKVNQQEYELLKEVLSNE